MDQIDRLRLFMRVVERGSFSAAAADLGIKQSTASKAIAELEHSLGTRLLERTTRSLRVTTSGDRFVRSARHVLDAYDAAINDLGATVVEPRGRIRLSAPVVFGRRFLYEPLASFAARHPDVQLDVVFDDHYVNLVEEAFDLVVRVGIPVDTSARGRKLADGRRCLVASPRYIAEHGTPKKPRDLRQHACITHLPASAPNIWRFRNASGDEVRVRVNARVTCNNSEAALHFVRRGLGISLVADWLVEDDLREKRLVALMPSYEPPPGPVYALTPPGPFTPPAVQLLVEHLAAHLGRKVACT